MAFRHQVFTYGLGDNMKYTFFSRDYFANSGDYDFSKLHYLAIIDFCFTHSWCFSLVFWDDHYGTDRTLNSWNIPNPGFLFQNETNPSRRLFFSCCKESRDFILRETSSIFDFVWPKPEDITFYRRDGSVLFDSIAHEGECSIFPRLHEDISEILAHGHWIRMEGGTVFEEGSPCAPACDHQIVPCASWNMFEEPLFVEIRRIQFSNEYETLFNCVSELVAYIDTFCKKVQYCITGDHCSPLIRYMPQWYVAFKLFVLGQCHENTNTALSVAFINAGFRGKEGIHKFFEYLDSYVSYYVSKLGL